MVLYGIPLVPLAHNFREADPTLLPPFYSDNASFGGSSRRRSAQLKLMIDQGTYRGYFLDLAKLIFIAKNPEDEEAASREFE